MADEYLGPCPCCGKLECEIKDGGGPLPLPRYLRRVRVVGRVAVKLWNEAKPGKNA